METESSGAEDVSSSKGKEWEVKAIVDATDEEKIVCTFFIGSKSWK